MKSSEEKQKQLENKLKGTNDLQQSLDTEIAAALSKVRFSDYSMKLLNQKLDFENEKCADEAAENIYTVNQKFGH